MAKERKSPQEKKANELTKDHYTLGSHSARAFPRVWKRKKTLANQEFRRKSDKLLGQAKPGLTADEAILITGELTAKHFEASVLRKTLQKFGTVTVGGKIKCQLGKRKATVGRRVQDREREDNEATQAVTTLCGLEGQQLVDVIQRAALVCRGGDPIQFTRMYISKDSLDRALLFVRNVHCGSANARDTLRRNPKLCVTFNAWVGNANRLLSRPRLIAIKKKAEEQALKRKLGMQRVDSKIFEGT